MALRAARLATLVATLALLGAVSAVIAQTELAPPPEEQHPVVTLTCERASGSLEGHVHLVGARGRPARYLELPVLTCDGTAQPLATAETVWWTGSLWHLIIVGEADGQAARCEDEGVLLPTMLQCSVTPGAVYVSINLPPTGEQAGPTRTPAP